MSDFSLRKKPFHTARGIVKTACAGLMGGAWGGNRIRNPLRPAVIDFVVTIVTARRFVPAD